MPLGSVLSHKLDSDQGFAYEKAILSMGAVHTDFRSNDAMKS